MLRHGSVVRPTMFLVGMDIKTAFDEARPRHIAKIMEDHNAHGWLISAFLREMARLEGQATFEKYFFFRQLLSPGERRSPQIVAEDGHAALGKSGRGTGKGPPSRSGRAKHAPYLQLSRVLTTSGSCSIRRPTSNRC